MANESERLTKVEQDSTSENLKITVPEAEWKTHSINRFECCLVSQKDMKKMNKNIKNFYEKQNALIEELISVNNYIEIDEEQLKNSSDHCHRIRIVNRMDKDELLSKIVLFANLVLLVGKIVATVMSGSLSLISSLVDSVTDLLSGSLMWWTARRMRKFNPYIYPQGRRRLEPISIIILSVFMAVASFQITRESIGVIIEMATNNKGPPYIGIATIIIMILTILIKMGLWITLWKCGTSESSAALLVDCRNDTISNSAALLFSSLSYHINYEGMKYLDPSGAIVIAIFIIYGWLVIGLDNVKALSGHTADARFLQKMTFIALNHHPEIKYVDTVRAFHFGINFLVEVDIVLDRNMILCEAHDIGESLQKRLECLNEVERCFVHLDYEFDHDPRKEHKLV